MYSFSQTKQNESYYVSQFEIHKIYHILQCYTSKKKKKSPYKYELPFFNQL